MCYGWFYSFADESSGVPKDMDMGDLFDSLSGKGFSAKGKRSVTSNKSEVSYFRYLARFRRIPALESDSYVDDDEWNLKMRPFMKL